MTAPGASSQLQLLVGCDFELTTVPALKSPRPPRYLVARSTTKSAAGLSQDWLTGVAPQARSNTASSASGDRCCDCGLRLAIAPFLRAAAAGRRGRAVGRSTLSQATFSALPCAG
jgi:hypothetical protein